MVHGGARQNLGPLGEAPVPPQALAPPRLRSGVEESRALSSALGPKMSQTKRSVEQLLGEVAVFEVLLETKQEANIIAEVRVCVRAAARRAGARIGWG